MADTIYYSSKYHVIRPERSVDRWLSSFNIFKSMRATPILNYDERPPYPILISNPTIKQVIANMNKSDFLVFFACEFVGFASCLYLTRKIRSLRIKFQILSLYIIGFTHFGLTMATYGSYYRLIGLMDNGLTWKKKDSLFNKYDFSKDFEETTIFKYLRERPSEN
jgi:hypothetical protein